MALQKQNININFDSGLDTKRDPWQLQSGKFLALSNSVFQKGGQLQKRNGYGLLPSVSNSPSFLSTYVGNLVALGTNLQVLSQDTNTWISRGSIQPVVPSVIQAVRASLQISATDAAVAPNGLACCVFVDSSSNVYYQVIDSVTGQIIVSQITITGANSPRVFSLGNYFVITFLKTITATAHLQYIAIPIGNPSNPGTAVDFSTLVKSTTTGYDAISAGGALYLSFSDSSSSIRSTFMDSQLNQRNTLVTASHTADRMSVAIDLSGTAPVMWVSFWDSGSTNGFTMAMAVGGQLSSLLAPTQIITGVAVAQITSYANNTVNNVFYETNQTYNFSSVRSDYISSVLIQTGGTVSQQGIILRGVGLAGKSFFLSSTRTGYMLVAYNGAFQPVYFLMDTKGNVVSKLAYENGGGYIASQVLPGANLSGSNVIYAYLYKFIAVPVNAAQGAPTSAAIYGQAGVNLVNFSINLSGSTSQEIAGAIHITGGFVWEYDGNRPVEHQFHVFPEDVVVTTATGSGNLTAQLYYYYWCYAWTDGAGNVHRSAPSIPYPITTTTSNSTNTIKVPTLRQTYKVLPNAVRIEGYRWSAAQEVPYMITSQTAPVLNDPTIDNITFVDTLADSSIIGNEILYTEGGVVEDIAAPATAITTLFKSRMFVVDAEDPNTMWLSKVVIEETPVEFSDVLTFYVAPTISAQGSTGPITALSAMDDKLIIFKKNAIYYLTGDGPDNTGNNSDYGDAVFITGTVGCSNPQSIVLTPDGLMFQSDKGIWILGRNLSTVYIGAAVEQFNSATVLSALTVPGTNQVRFTMSTGVTLMYDYYFQQWGTFVGIPGVSSTIYQLKHTFLDSFGRVFQETPGLYVDGSEPVLLSFTTSWINLAGIQGYQRAYEFYLLGQYLSPHKLQIGIAHDYNTAISQQVLIQPNNFAGVFGSDAFFGSGSPYGGPSQVEQWRIFFTRQKCQSFQLTLTEVYDPSFKVPAGAGLTLSGLNVVYGMNKNYPRLPSRQQIG